MSIRRLQTLVAFADTGSFAGAAERVHLTAAAVGQQMKALEEEIGQPLFDRDSRAPTLNARGQAMVPRARKLLRDYQALIAGLEVEEVPELTIGAVSTAMTGLIPETLLALRQSEPRLHLRIVPGLSADLLGQVDRGSLDAAVISQPRREAPHLAWQTVAVEPLVLVTPAGLEDSDPVRILKEFPFIRFSRNAWVGEQIDNWLLGQGITVRESMELASLEAIHTMVSADLGVSIVPEHCIPPRRPMPVRRIPLDDELVRVLGLVWRRDSMAYGAIALLAELFTSLASTENKR